MQQGLLLGLTGVGPARECLAGEGKGPCLLLAPPDCQESQSPGHPESWPLKVSVLLNTAALSFPDDWVRFLYSLGVQIPCPHCLH